VSARRPLSAALLLAVLTACSPETPPTETPAGGEPAPSAPSAPSASGAAAGEAGLLLNGLLNSGFELVADSTTDPPKYGAYWLGAFEPVEGSAVCYVVEDRPFRGDRFLRLSHATGEVLQKIAADPRWTDELQLILALRCAREGRLLVTLEDGPGRRVTLEVATSADGVSINDSAGRPVDPTLARPEADGWWRLSLPIGRLFVAEHGQRPVPRLNLRLSAGGPQRALADVDEIVAALPAPRGDASVLAAAIEELVRWSLQAWLLPPDRGGLGLVHPERGTVVSSSYDVETGRPGPPDRLTGFHTVHVLLIEWLHEARRRGREEELLRWGPHLERLARTLLAHNVDPETGLPRLVDASTLEPSDAALTVGLFIELLLDVHQLVADAELGRNCLQQARAMADRLITLQREHDLPPDDHPPLRWVRDAGHYTGPVAGANWFGFIPDRLTPAGEIEADRPQYTSWAILTGRTFWYELMRSPRAIVAVHQLQPRPGDLQAVLRAVSRYEREWDAARYDLENDTDDHYGYLVEDLLELIERHGEAGLDELNRRALGLVQQATDHRLSRQAASAGETLWIQAVRLGTACAGDSPRAFQGPLGLYALPPSLNPVSSGLELYREALLELAANDFKGRQLTNGQFTESFFENWEMVCICYRGTEQGDCRDHPPDYWWGDVGDTFGGPPTSAIDAQARAFRVAGPAGRELTLSRLEVIRHATDSSLRRRHGYLFGLDESVARQYELPDKYVIGLSSQSAAGLAYAMAWMRLLPHLPDTAAPQPPQVEAAADGATLIVSAPPGALVALPSQQEPVPGPIGEHDPRLLALDPAALPVGLVGVPRVTADERGRAELPRSALGVTGGLVQPLTIDPASGEVVAVGAPLSLD
jgi:hypothetical protein